MKKFTSDPSKCLLKILLVVFQVKREKEERRQREYEAKLEKELYEHRKAMGHYD